MQQEISFTSDPPTFLDFVLVFKVIKLPYSHEKFKRLRLFKFSIFFKNFQKIIVLYKLYKYII